MATQLQIRRGTTAQMNAFTGAEGELAVNTSTDTVHVHDGSTAGGFALAKADGSNIGTYAGSFTTLAASGAVTLSSTLAVAGTATMDGLYVEAASGYGFMEIGGPSGAFIDLKSPMSDDYDLRLRTTGTSGELVFPTGDFVFTRGSIQKLAVTATGIDVNGTATMDWLTVDGNVGIGDSTFAAGKLQVYDSAGNHVWLKGRASDGTSSVSFRNNSDNTYNGRIQVADTGGMQFAVGGTERMRIDSDGQVGVSSRKGFRFGYNELQGNAGSSGGGYPVIGYNIRFTGNSGDYGTLVGDTSWRINIGDNARLQIHSRSGAAAVASGAAYTAGPYVALNGTTWTGGSDERLKENVSTITGADAIARVKAMRPVNYSWIHDSESANQLGFIAQEMLSAVPEVVDVPETETDPITQQTLMWGITYDRLIPVLTAALQEALTKIETLEGKVQTLENN